MLGWIVAIAAIVVIFDSIGRGDSGLKASPVIVILGIAVFLVLAKMGGGL